MKYDPLIHSQIHPASEPPVNVGRYPACLDLDICEKDLKSWDIDSSNPDDQFMYYWDGKYWCFASKVPVWHQDRRWFGLREKPKC